MEATTPTGATSTTFSTPTTLTVLAHLCEQIEAGRIAEAKVEASKLLDDGVFRFGEHLSVAYGHLRWNEPSADTQRLFALLDHQNLQHEDLLRCQVARLGRLILEASLLYGGHSDSSKLRFRLERILTNEPDERVRLRFELSCAIQALAAHDQPDIRELAAAIRKETGPFACNDNGWYSSALLLTWVGSLCCRKNEHLGILLSASGSNNDENVTLAAIDAYNELTTCSDEGRRQVACSQLVALCRDSRWHVRYRAVEVLLTLVTDTAFVKQVEPALFSLRLNEENPHIVELLNRLDSRAWARWLKRHQEAAQTNAPPKAPPPYSPPCPPAQGMDPRVHRTRDYLTNLAEVGVGGVEVVLPDLKAAVEGGAVDARYELAICLALKKDPAAIPLLIREEQWHPRAQFLLAVLVPEEALNFLIPLAQEGDPRANLALGDLYWEGRNPVQKSPQQAYMHWKRAAEAGNRRAKANVGYCLAQGIATKPDLEEALSWLSQAAARGDREAHFNRAVCLLRRNQEGDVQAAAKHLSEADTLPDPALKEEPLSVLSQFASITFTVDEFRDAAQQVDSPLAKRLLAFICARQPLFNHFEDDSAHRRVSSMARAGTEQPSDHDEEIDDPEFDEMLQSLEKKALRQELRNRNREVDNYGYQELFQDFKRESEERKAAEIRDLNKWYPAEKDLTQAVDAGDKVAALELAAYHGNLINRDQLHVLLSKAGIAMPHEHPLSTLHVLTNGKPSAQRIPFSADRTAYSAWDVCQHPKASGEAVQKCWEIAIRGGCREARSGLIENYLRFQTFHPSDDLLYRRFLDIDTGLWEQYKPQFRSWLRPGYLLAECYRLGIGGKKDPVKAVQMLWTELRNTSCPKTRSRLALCYALGVGVDRDRSTALKIIREGRPLLNFAQGRLNQSDRTRIEELLGDSDKMSSAKRSELYMLGWTLQHAGDERAHLFYRYSAVKGDRLSMLALARLTDDIGWYQKAVKAGSVNALFELGLCFGWGIGTEVNRVEARRLLLKAALAGHALAKDWLRIDFSRSEPLQSDDNDAQANMGLDEGEDSLGNVEKLLREGNNFLPRSEPLQSDDNDAQANTGLNERKDSKIEDLYEDEDWEDLF